jgi:hypothetical protein
MNMNERKEIVQVPGIVILAVMVVLADALAGFLLYRWHESSVFIAERVGQALYTEVLREEHDVKEVIRTLEGVVAFEDTQYAQSGRYSVSVNVPE